jgi:predicted alpha/beta superfamily hydrolase
MKNIIRFRFMAILIGSALTLSNSIAQRYIILNDSIFSKVLNEQRKFKIYFPEDIRTGSGEKYDAVYILDGEEHLDDFIFISNFARKQKLIPPLILISVQNSFTKEGNMRDRDFYPERSPGNTKAGGAENFKTFLKNELIPYISRKFPVSGDNSLFGHSAGGVFIMYSLLTEPGLFMNYFCSDPAFPWYERRIIKMTENIFKNIQYLNKTLWIIGTEETYRNVGIEMMDSVLMNVAPKDLRWKTSIYPNETHMSVRLKGIYDGLKYAYEGYNSKKLVEFHPNNGSLIEGKPAAVFLNGRFKDVHYTVDGSEPDQKSAKAPQMININGPCVVKVKWLGDNKKYITTSTGNFELSRIWPALQSVRGIKHGGLHYSYFEGKWDSLPDFTKLKAARTGIADSSFSFEQLPSRSDFGCVFEGYIKIDTDDYYSFALCSSDGSRFFINDHEIINNDGMHGSEWYRSYLVPLQKGYYPIRLEYFQRTGSRYFDLIYISPKTFETVRVNFKNLYYK